jgi:hypothetical protein
MPTERTKIPTGDLPETTQESSKIWKSRQRGKFSRRFLICLVLIPAVVFCAGVAGSYRSLLLVDDRSSSARALLTKARNLSVPDTVVFHYKLRIRGKTILQPPPLKIIIPRAPDFGEITDLMIYEDEGMARFIYRNLQGERGFSADEDEEKSERGYFDYVYAFDDDYERNPYQLWEDEKLKDEIVCRRTSWHRRNPINCNSMHEHDLPEETRRSRTKYLR